jgi:hypothetical protein
MQNRARQPAVFVPRVHVRPQTLRRVAIIELEANEAGASAIGQPEIETVGKKLQPRPAASLSDSDTEG